MKIEVWLDFTCPYCYIAVKELQQALDEFEHNEYVEMHYMSYPMPKPLEADIKEKTCKNRSTHEPYSLEQREKLERELNEFTEKRGISLRFDPTCKADTLHAHRLMKLASCYEKQNRVIEAIFDEYFMNEKTIDDYNVLLNVGLQAGLNKEEVDALLCLNQYKKQVQEDKELAQDIGISSVPFFIINEQYAIVGAQSVQFFKELLEDVWQEMAETGNLRLPREKSESTYCEGNKCSIASKKKK